MLAAGARFGAEIVPVRRPLRPHGHDFLELAVVLAGSGTHVTRDGAMPVGRGDAVVVRACDWHGWDAPHALRVANVYVDQSALRGELPTLSGDHRLRALAWPGPSTGVAGVARLHGTALRDVESAVAGMDSAPSTTALGHLLVVLGSITAALPAVPDQRAPHPAVIAAVTRMEREIAAPWTVRTLADSGGISEGHLSRLFRRAFSAAPMAVLAGLRGERAAAQLVATDRPIAEIGRLVGWPDPNYFARRFRALRGVSPREYRARFR